MTPKLTGILLIALALMLASGCDRQQAQVSSPAAQHPAPVPSAPPEDVDGSVAMAVSRHEAPANVQAGGNCALDAINGGGTARASVRAGSEAVFGGWVADASNEIPGDPKLLFKSGQNAFVVPLALGVERPDVAKALAAEALARSGYNVVAKLDVPAGQYDLSIVHGPADAVMSCPLNVSLSVTQ